MRREGFQRSRIHVGRWYPVWSSFALIRWLGDAAAGAEGLLRRAAARSSRGQGSGFLGLGRDRGLRRVISAEAVTQLSFSFSLLSNEFYHVYNTDIRRYLHI